MKKLLSKLVGVILLSIGIFILVIGGITLFNMISLEIDMNDIPPEIVMEVVGITSLFLAFIIVAAVFVFYGNYILRKGFDVNKW